MNDFFQKLLGTSDDPGAAIARVVAGLVMFPHGAQKLLGWFGGYGFGGTMDYLTGQAGLPWIIALIVVLTESVGAVLLIVGGLSRLVALGFVAVMVGAILQVHASHGFFMNWSGQQDGEGFEYHLLMIGLALVVLVKGGGAYSVDRKLAA